MLSYMPNGRNGDGWQVVATLRCTQDAVHGFEEKQTGKLLQLVISYEDDGGNAKIMIYRNGKVIGNYKQGPIVSWGEGDVEARGKLATTWGAIKNKQTLTCKHAD